MKKNKKEKKNRAGLYILLGIVFIISFSIFVSSFYTTVKFNNITYSEYKDLYNKSDLEFVYVGRKGCDYCKITVPYLGELQDELNMTFNYLDTDTMTKSNFDDIATTSEAFAGEWGTPTLLAIKDGKVLSYIDGYREKDIIKAFIEASLKGEKYVEVSYEDSFKSITYSEYKDLYNKSDLVFVYVGRPGCSHCKDTMPILVSLQDEYQIKFNYLNTDTMTEENFNDIGNTSEAFEGEWGTPTMLAIKDKKVLNYVSGAQGETVIKNFVEKSLDGVEIE